MPYLLVRHKVADYAKWKSAYDEHRATRQASGSKGAHVFRNADDPSEVVLLFEWDALEKARAFAHSEDLRQKMQQAGVAEQPGIYFLDEQEQGIA